MSDRGVDRNQTKDAESILNTRQDRNTFLTGGGTWSWDVSTGQISWSEDFVIQVGSAGQGTVVAGNRAGLNGNGEAFGVTINRATGGVSGGVWNRFIGDPANYQDDAVILGVRQGFRLYLRDGTVFDDKESKVLGSAERSTDRVDYASDGRLNPAPYTTAIFQSQYTAGATDGTGLIYTDGAANFPGDIPNTGGVPDTPSVIDIYTQGVFEIASVDSTTQITLVSAAGGGLSGLTADVYTEAIGYEVGSKQLAVFANGALQVAGGPNDYQESGAAGQISYQIVFNGGKEPPVAQPLAFIDIAGGQGPAGPEASATLQQTYDRSIPSQINTTSPNPIDLNAPNPGDVVLRGRHGGGPTQSQLTGAGEWIANAFRVPDGFGDHFEFIQIANELVIRHTATNKGWRIDNQGKLSPYAAALSPSYVRWSTYAGTFNATPAPVTIPTGITSGVWGAVFMLEDQVVGSRFYMGALQEAADATADVIISYDETTGDIDIAGDFAGSGNPGGDFASGDYRLILFHQS